jgi:hypothetical protein
MPEQEPIMTDIPPPSITDDLIKTLNLLHEYFRHQRDTGKPVILTRRHIRDFTALMEDCLLIANAMSDQLASLTHQCVQLEAIAEDLEVIGLKPKDIIRQNITRHGLSAPSCFGAPVSDTQPFMQGAQIIRLFPPTRRKTSVPQGARGTGRGTEGDLS